MLTERALGEVHGETQGTEIMVTLFKVRNRRIYAAERGSDRKRFRAALQIKKSNRYSTVPEVALSSLFKVL